MREHHRSGGWARTFILNSEVRFPLHINKSPGGVIFYDGGNVYSAINLSNFVNNYTNTVGIGLRYSTPIGPVRIDVGRNLNPVSGLSATQYYITLGQPLGVLMNWRKIIGWTLASLTGLILIGAVAGYFYLEAADFANSHCARSSHRPSNPPEGTRRFTP